MSTDPSKWKLNHTMLRVKDPQRSIDFYKFLGLTQINKIAQPEAKFDLYFLAFDGPSSCSPQHHWTDREGVLELTHNYGTENDPDFKVANGNEEPGKGFGHIAISVDNIQAACQRLEDAGYPFQKKLADGKMHNIAFVKDPDSYWVEIIPQNPLGKTEGVKETDTQSYRFNHSMIRVKDKDVSLKFYQEVMGMKLIRTLENKSANFNLYFLGYAKRPQEEGGVNPIAHEGLLELTWNYGTEKQEGRVYHDGNTEPQGFGHICVAVDDLNAACQYLEDKKVNWKKRLADGRMKTVAFVLDADGYSIELIQNEKLKRSAN
jgi:lactoylglutathione lyase